MSREGPAIIGGHCAVAKVCVPAAIYKMTRRSYGEFLTIMVVSMT